MKVRMLMSLLAAVVIAITTGAAAEVGKTYTIDKGGSDEEVVCTGDRTVDAVEVNSNNPLTFSWNPLCTSLESGFTVTWGVPSPAIRDHNPSSELDGGACFRSSAALPSGQGANISPNRDFEVQFKYESGFVSARVVFTNPDGSHSFGDWHSCPGALDLDQTTLNEAVIPYLCTIHPNMQGLVVVEASGSISVG